MAITTYAELKTAIGNWTARSDLTSYLDEFIDLAETYIKRDPAHPDSPEIGGVRGNIQRATGTLSTSASTLALPTDFLEGYRLNLTADADFKVLRYVAPNQLSLHHRSGTGQPAFYTISDVIEFEVKPDSEYAYEFSYYPQATALSDSNTSNFVLASYPDVYLSGCLFHAFRFLQDEQQASSWLGQYKTSAWTASETYRRPRASQGTIGIKTDSANP
tara:strand:+ start:558 stop:1208 length:651 start_codon:yes stop_codon:yes gene_type:complete